MIALRLGGEGGGGLTKRIAREKEEKKKENSKAGKLRIAREKEEKKGKFQSRKITKERISMYFLYLKI